MSSSGSSLGAFSFDTPQAVMHVLASVRKSDISANDKNSLRDLVLSYTNGGKDPSLKIQIEQQLTRLSVQPLPQSTPAASTSTPAPEFGSSRNVPVTFTAATPVAEPAAVPPAPQPAPVTPPAPVVQPAPVAVPPMQPAPVTPAPQPAPVAPIQPPVQPAPVVVPPSPTPASTPTPAPSVDNSAALARVREIKSIVNEKIGNPVNLVDIDNTVGREYMSALLDAMKQLSSGVNSASTMDRLEAAFADVERVLEQPRPAAEPTPVAVSQESTIEPIPDAQPVPVAQPAPAPEPEPEPAPELKPTPEPVPVPVETETQPTVETKSEVSLPTPPVEQQNPTPQPPSTPIEDTRWSAAGAAIKPAPVKSLSESTQPLKSIADVPTQDSITNKEKDPLRSQEVNEGLNQLLSDWVLFKKSGLFGTGPKGVEHPLYQKIKELQIPLLLAGRFEGATQEIKQSITDYMNGWRYEQGIIYEQGETFDHYLRRVIRHILDLQK